ncbi:MAG: hypothetical protein A2075_23475 [Geobacteraceae bacterium GWC2_58_44]|nr:MAG: hypothetical protein A2075_23475 [Geobacteraceae bacterium GWC2_58_44]
MGVILRRSCPIPTPTLPLKGREFFQRKISASQVKLSGDSVNHVGWAVPTIRMRLWWARPTLPLIPLT